jgi:GT2 family glycosyltransferase
MKLSIIIPTYNRKPELELTLKSTLAQSFKDFEILVIDNGPSTDGTPEMVQKFVQQDERVRYISTTVTGTIPARNLGLHESQGEIFLTLDDDVEFLEPNTIANLIKTFDNDPKAGVVGGIELREPDQSLNKQTGDLPAETGRISIAGDFDTNFTALYGRGNTEVDHVRSAFMGIRKRLLLEIGGFDQMYHAMGMGFRYESDVCLKIQRLSYKVLVNPELLIWHKGAERSRGFKRSQGAAYFFYANRNHAYFMRRFFWFNQPFKWAIKDILVGAYRTPGLLWCWRKFREDGDWRWLPNVFFSIVGKIYGHMSYGFKIRKQHA